MGSDENKTKEGDSGDYLGYDVYAKTLWARIQAALNKDIAHRETSLREGRTPPTLGEDPLVVGIFGEWGAGKSKLLSMVQKLAEGRRDLQIKEHKHDGYQAVTVPVFFQPWKYEHEKHLLVPLLMHILVELESTLKTAQNFDDKATGKALEVVSATKSVLSSALKKVGDLSQAVGQVLGVADPTATAPIATMVQMLAHGMADMMGGKPKRKAAREFEQTNNGRSYYEMHRILSEMTRPAKNSHTTGGQHHDKDFCLNFVIFIDDLDRCLPEKAVETLELIKTVFNLESFAFVLALDEEVVERGIGHRYKDYALVNKKPEMPITGFEYLEKIVHLPFRLPPLTNRQAALFVRKHEQQIQPDADKRWFDAPAPEKETGDGKEPWLRDKGVDRLSQMDLLPLVLSCFDHFVPRKLIRLVELMKQLADVTNTKRRNPIDRRYGGEIDPRIVTALVLLQLFSPEVYRFLRRRPEAFSTLLSSFATEAKRLLGHHVSDADLCDWVVPLDVKRANLRSAPLNERGLRGQMDRLSDEIARHWSDPRERAAAQNLRLPLVALLLEHRALARNVFDPIKLFQVLASDMRHTGQNPAGVVLRPYLRLLTEKVERNGAERLNRHRVHQVDALFDDMVFDDEPARNNIQARHDIPEDACLTRQTVTELATKALEKFEFSKQLVNEVERASGTESAAPYSTAMRHHFLHALSRLDQAIAKDDRQPWAEVLKQFQEAFEEIPPGEALESPAAAAHYWNLKSRWGFDERFQTEAPSLVAERWPHHENAEEDEPIAGFVRVPADASFVIGSEQDENDNPKGVASLTSPFYMARYLTTVGQYAHFVKDKGYENEAWWDSQGWAWKNMQWASETNDPAFRGHLDSRTKEQRSLPWDWADQLKSPSQPVWGVNWFEARAYVRWLMAKLQPQLIGSLKGYEACLPTELQWERAARFTGLNETNDHLYPGGREEDGDIHLVANIQGSLIGAPSVVGCFAPNPLGICDLHGNLWEWQDNLYGEKPLHEGCERIARITHRATDKRPGKDWLKTDEARSKSDRPALRGGSWGNAAGLARASIRGGDQPDGWDDVVGFRVVLSLAKLPSET